MRVIAGKYKGKILFSPEGNNTRPTTDKIKETVFNILYSKKEMENASVLDLFAGTGALGIEALSRGASYAVFIDHNKYAYRLIKENLAKTGVKEKTEVYCTDFDLALKKLNGKKFDFIFCDPPYDAGLEKRILDLILKYDILSEEGIIFIEHSSKKYLPNLANSFIIDTRDCGTTAISFLQRSNK